MAEAQYDESGGYWETADDGNGNTYYYHTVTGETTWDNPYAGYDSDAYYGQAQYDGTDQGYYTDAGYDSAGNGTWGQGQLTDGDGGLHSGYDSGEGQVTADGWMTLQDEYGQTYYYNQHTGVSSWTAPGAEEYSAISEGSSLYPDTSMHADTSTGLLSPSNPMVALTVDTNAPYGVESDQLAVVSTSKSAVVSQTPAPQADNPYYPWITEYDENYNAYYRNVETGETQYYNPTDTYQPQDGYSSVQPNEFSYTGVGYGGYDANASSYDLAGAHGDQYAYDSNQYYGQQQDYFEHYSQGYQGGYWDDSGNYASADPYAQHAAQGQVYDESTGGWSASYSGQSPSRGVGFSAGEGAEPTDEAQEFMAQLEAAMASQENSEAAAKRRAEEEAKADAEALAARERLEAAEAKRSRREQRKKEKWDMLSENERRRIEALRAKNKKHKGKVEMEERVQEAKDRILANKLKRPCQQCLARESDCVCKQCNPAIETPLCDVCWKEVHEPASVAGHERLYYAVGLTRRLKYLKDAQARRTRRKHERELKHSRATDDFIKMNQWQQFVDHLGNTAWYNNVTQETVYSRPYVFAAVENSWQDAELRQMRAEDTRRLYVRRLHRTMQRREARKMRNHGLEIRDSPGNKPAWSAEVVKLAKGSDFGDMHMETDSDDTWTDDHWSSEETSMLEAPPPPPKALPPIPPPPPLGTRKKGRVVIPEGETELTEDEKVALAAKFKTNKEIRHEKRRRRAERADHKKKKALQKLIAARERALQRGEVWEKQDDGMGNVLYRNTKTGERTVDNPIKRARRAWEDKCKKAGVNIDWKNDEYTVQFKGKSHKEVLSQFLLDMKVNEELAKEATNAMHAKAAASGVFVPVTMKVKDVNVAVVGGALIRIVIDPSKVQWQPKAHNHMFILLDGKEYCVICRRQRHEYLANYWSQKVADYKRWLEQRFVKENQDEEKRIKHVQHIVDVFRSAREVGRRNRMSIEGKRAEKKRFAKFMRKAEEERAVFEKHRGAAVLAERNRAGMEAEETSQKDFFNEELTTRENREILFQESMRDEWADVVAESVGQERMKHLSWQRGIKRGTFSSFHIVRDVNYDRRFVIKAMPIRFPTVEPRVLRAVEELQELSKENQSLVRIFEVFKHGAYPAKRGGLRLGCTLFVLMEYCSGGTLHDRIHCGKKLAPKEMYAYALQAAIGVSWLHRGGRSHDNICSRNYLFSDNTKKALLKLIGFVTLPIESRSRLKQVDVESRLGAYLEEPLSKAQQLQHSQRAAKLAEEAALLLQASPAQELDMRNEEATRKAAGDARVAASSQGLDRLPQSAEDIERERKLGQREVVDVILSSKPSVFLPDSLPKEDKQRTTTELEAVTPEKPIAQRTATAKKIEEIAVKKEMVEFASVIGSDAQYMAPERLKLGKPSNAADVWALGCVIYEIVTGEVPYMHQKPWDHIVTNVPRAVAPLFLPLFKAVFQPDPSKRASSLQVLMYLRSVKDGKYDVPGDVSLLPVVPDLPNWPLKTPAKELHDLAAKMRRTAVSTHSPRDKPREEEKAKDGHVTRQLYSPVRVPPPDTADNKHMRSPYPGPVLLQSAAIVPIGRAPRRLSGDVMLPSLTHTPAAPLTIAKTSTDPKTLAEDPLLRRHVSEKLASAALTSPGSASTLSKDLLPSGARLLSLAPMQATHKTLLERIPDAVVTSNPISPLFHRRPVMPVFRGQPPTETTKLVPPLSDNKPWEPSDDYAMRHGVPSEGGLRKRNMYLARGLGKPLPAKPLPLPDKTTTLPTRTATAAAEGISVTQNPLTVKRPPDTATSYSKYVEDSKDLISSPITDKKARAPVLDAADGDPTLPSRAALELLATPKPTRPKSTH